MSVAATERHYQLRQGVESGAQQSAGVIVIEDILSGARVRARVSRPYEPIELETHQQVRPAPDVQTYAIERAAPPVFSVSGLNFRGRGPVLVATGSGPMLRNKFEPVWVPVTYVTPNTLKVRRGGKRVHDFVMPGYSDVNTNTTGATMGGLTSVLPNIGDPNRQSEPRTRHLLRIRYAADPLVVTDIVSAATLVTLAGGELRVGGVFPNNHVNIVPGSVRITIAAATFMRDDGFGRLVSEVGSAVLCDGRVDYLTGAWSLEWPASAPAGAFTVLVDYEHNCPFIPLDVALRWDALLGGS